jgi:hypothetical protein
MLWISFLILLVLWLVGVVSHIGGGMIDILLVMAVGLLVFNLVSRQRAVGTG